VTEGSSEAAISNGAATSEFPLNERLLKTADEGPASQATAEEMHLGTIVGGAQYRSPQTPQPAPPSIDVQITPRIASPYLKSQEDIASRFPRPSNNPYSLGATKEETLASTLTDDSPRVTSVEDRSSSDEDYQQGLQAFYRRNKREITRLLGYQFDPERAIRIPGNQHA
jgi:hypothetical protein